MIVVSERIAVAGDEILEIEEVVIVTFSQTERGLSLKFYF